MVLINERKQIYFDPEAHRYFQKLPTGERDIPGVTTILETTGHITGKRFFKAKHSQRGKYVHLACFLDDCGTLDEATIDPVIMPYVQAYRKWKADYRPEIIEHEKGVYSEVLDHAGTFDLLVALPGKRPRVIVDLKSGLPADWHKYQLVGYDIAYAGTKWLQYEIACLYLRADETYRWKPYLIHEQMALGAEWRRLVRQSRDTRAELFGEAV